MMAKRLAIVLCHSSCCGSAAIAALLATAALASGSESGLSDLLSSDDACSDGDDCRLELLQRRSPDGKPNRTLGVVDAIWTFGAPATSNAPMPNLQSEDQCFGGVRTYTENKMRGGGRLTDAAAMFDAYPHAKVATLALDWGQDSYFVECNAKHPGVPQWPAGGTANWGLHTESNYAPRLKKLTINGRPVKDKEPFATVLKFATLAYKAYDSQSNTIKEVAQKLPGWRLVDRQVFEWVDGAYDDDPIMLLQDNKTLDCALVFTGTNHFGELFESINVRAAPYCGFPGVHAGYRDEIIQLSQHTIWKGMQSKLSKCNRVNCVGHSLGGAMCDVFAGCVNSHRKKNKDFQKLMWYKQTPKLMPEIGTADELGAILDSADPFAHLGRIDSLYTYGSPATASPPLRNPHSDDGCFEGLRVYAETDMAGGGKQVDARAFHNNFWPHPRMRTVSLQWNQPSHFAKCGEGVRWPEHHALSYDNWGMHKEKNYVDRLDQLTIRFVHGDEAVWNANRFVRLAYGPGKTKKELLAIMAQSLPGWNLVARQILDNDKEPALLAQDTNSLNCTLVLPGGNAWRSKTYGTSFCGLENVHHGYRNELSRMTQTLGWPSLTSKMEKCSAVACVGHSKGGALCELLAACVNSEKLEDQDFRRMMWAKKTPSLLPALH